MKEIPNTSNETRESFILSSTWLSLNQWKQENSLLEKVFPLVGTKKKTCSNCFCTMNYLKQDLKNAPKLWEVETSQWLVQVTVSTRATCHRLTKFVFGMYAASERPDSIFIITVDSGRDFEER